MQETQDSWVQSLGWEDPLERKCRPLTPIFFSWKIPWTKEPNVLQSKGCKESDTAEQLSMHAVIKKRSRKGKNNLGLEELYFITNLLFTCLAYLGCFVETSGWVGVREVFGLYHNVYIWVSVYSQSAFLLPVLFFDYWTFLKYNM